MNQKMNGKYCESIESALSGESIWLNPHRILFKDGSVIVDDGSIPLESVINKVLGSSLTNTSLDANVPLFVTSDQHFGHELVKRERGFKTVEDHDEFMIRAWNSVVTENAVVVMLGDVTVGSLSPLSHVEQLNGAKILVSGNHDRVWTRGKKPRAFDFYLEYFDAIVTKGSIKMSSHQAILSHIPPVPGEHALFMKARFKMERPAEHLIGVPVICGHVHKQWEVAGKCYNVGVDHTDGKPVPLSKALSMVRSLQGAVGLGSISDMTHSEIKLMNTVKFE